MRRYVIIGSGAAGIAAIEAIRSQDPGGAILMITEDRHGYYSRPGLAYYLSNEIPESLLYPFSAQDFKKLDVEWVTGSVIRLDIANHCVVLNTGEQIVYDRLLIATGSQAIRLTIPGVDLIGSVKLDSLDDAQGILRLVHRGRNAIVVGGGITALEIVEGLASRGMKVHYFLRESRYWSNVLDDYESHIIEKRLHEEGVQIHYYTEIGVILGARGKLTGVRTKKNETIPCDVLAIAIGVRPRIALAVGAGIKTDRGILVDEYMQTNILDVYAAGDVGQVLDPRTGKTVLDTLWGRARSQGYYAGLNMVGIQKPFIKQVSFNVTRLAGLTTTIIGTIGSGSKDPDVEGIARGDSETWRDPSGVSDRNVISSQSDFDFNRLRLNVNENKLVGAILIGDQSLSKALQQLILEQVDISVIRDQLLQPLKPLSEIIHNFYLTQQSNYAG